MLRLAFNPGTDGTGELCAQAAMYGFAGQGSAWFSVREVQAFARRLEAWWPSAQAMPLTLQGGHWVRTGQHATLDETHLRLTFCPIGSLGDIGCHVWLAAAPIDDWGREGAPSMQARFKTHCVPVATFARALDLLVQGRCGEALLGVP